MDDLADKINEISEITGKAMLSAVPFVGGPIIEIINSVKGNCLQKRQGEWFCELNCIMQQLNAL